MTRHRADFVENWLKSKEIIAQIQILDQNFARGQVGTGRA
jgi:hypothetical protein